MTAAQTWHLGQTLRWHSNPWPALRHSGDTVDAHQNRMIRLAKRYFPAIWRDLVEPIITHDLPEHWSGDWSTPDKDEIPGLRAALEAVDQIVWDHIGAATTAARHLLHVKWLDLLDAYLWAELHEPRAMASGGFPEAMKWLSGMAWQLGCADVFTADRA